MRRPQGVVCGTLTTMSLTIRLATEADVPTIGDIYNHYIEHSTCTFHLEPQSHEHYLAWFHDRSEAHPITIGVTDDLVVGWGTLAQRYW